MFFISLYSVVLEVNSLFVSKDLKSEVLVLGILSVVVLVLPISDHDIPLGACLQAVWNLVNAVSQGGITSELSSLSLIGQVDIVSLSSAVIVLLVFATMGWELSL